MLPCITLYARKEYIIPSCSAHEPRTRHILAAIHPFTHSPFLCSHVHSIPAPCLKSKRINKNSPRKSNQGSPSLMLVRVTYCTIQ